MNMSTITYAEVEELIKRLPEAKLPLIHRFLVALAESETDAPSPQLDFLLLPFAERQRVLQEQAAQMAAHYAQNGGGTRGMARGGSLL